MKLDYQLLNVMRALREKVKPPAMLVINNEGCFFNGENFGNDLEAAKAAQRKYYKELNGKQHTDNGATAK